MSHSSKAVVTVQALHDQVMQSKSRKKWLKLRTLLSKFGYAKRSDANTGEITSLLSDAGIALNPPIVRFGESWGIGHDDWIILSDAAAEIVVSDPMTAAVATWQADEWFDRITKIELRTEKEVEIKFIVPLLARLGYGDDDRYDGMPVPAAHGSKGTVLVIDFALFNSSLESLRHQPLLTVEAKREFRLKKREDLLKAHNQAKSYCLWTQCDFFLVTDSWTVQAFHIARGKLNDMSPLFVCERHELRDRFGDLYALISRDTLTSHYLAKLSTTDKAV